MRVSVLAGCALLVAACPALSTTIHLSPDGSGDYPTIQAAIDAASSGDEIVLADGTFTGDGNWDLDFGTKELVLRSANGYEATILDGGHDCYYVILHRSISVIGGQTDATRIEGLTFQNVVWEGDGGAIRCVGTSPIIRSCRFRLNHSWMKGSRGLDIFAQTGAPIIQDCLFQRNSCDYAYEAEGIAIYGVGSWLTIDRCSFSAIITNSQGGAVKLDGGTVTDCDFLDIDGNSQTTPNGRCLVASGGEVSIQNCRFLHTEGGGVRVLSSAQVLIGNCLFEHNVSDGGCCVSTSGATTIRNTSFLHNYSGFVGGIIECGSSLLNLDHCVFLDNKNGWPGGASAIYAYGTNLQVTHCTFVGNRSTSPIYQGSALTISQHTQLLMDHTIIAFGGQAGLPDGAIHCLGPASLDVSCSDFYDNEGGDWTGCVAGMDEVNKNFSADPLFCDVTGEDLSLHGDSPCAPVNTGECGLIGALGPWCGPLAVEPHSWGSIKALYR